MIQPIQSMSKAFDLSGKNAIVTGGARGLGAAISRALAEAGANVAIINSKSNADETLKSLQGFGGKYKSYIGNIANLSEIRETVNAIHADFGDIDILVNNAGISCLSDLLDMDDELSDWYNVTGVNLNGTVNMTYCVGKIMRDAGKGGAIINISSMAGDTIVRTQAMSPYSCSKAAINQFTRSVAWEFGKHDIRVNAIAPGFFNTDLSHFIPEEMVSYITGQQPLSRFGEPIEIGAMALYLASPAAAHVTGAVLTIDGGYSLSS